jgi:hypothetical protein
MRRPHYVLADMTERHAVRLGSLARCSSAIMRGAKPSIGAAYTEIAELKPRYGIKQFDQCFYIL